MATRSMQSVLQIKQVGLRVSSSARERTAAQSCSPSRDAVAIQQGGRVRGYKVGRPSRRVKPAAAAVSFPEDGGVVEAATDNQSGDIGTVSLSCRGFTHPKYE